MPTWASVDLYQVPPDLLPRATIFEVMQEPPDFAYRFFGTWQVSIHKADLTGSTISQLENEDFRSLISWQLNEVLAAREPLGFTIEIPRSGRFTFLSQIVRCPISEDGETISRIMSFETELTDAAYQTQPALRSKMQQVFG